MSAKRAELPLVVSSTVTMIGRWRSHPLGYAEATIGKTIQVIPGGLVYFHVTEAGQELIGIQETP